MTATEVKSLGEALQALSEMTRHTFVNVCAYGPIPLKVANPGHYLSINWDEELRQYVVDDRTGE
jgi:hypothetical protein